MSEIDVQIVYKEDENTDTGLLTRTNSANVAFNNLNDLSASNVEEFKYQLDSGNAKDAMDELSYKTPENGARSNRIDRLHSRGISCSTGCASYEGFIYTGTRQGRLIQYNESTGTGKAIVDSNGANIELGIYNRVDAIVPVRSRAGVYWYVVSLNPVEQTWDFHIFRSETHDQTATWYLQAHESITVGGPNNNGPVNYKYKSFLKKTKNKLVWFLSDAYDLINGITAIFTFDTTQTTFDTPPKFYPELVEYKTGIITNVVQTGVYNPSEGLEGFLAVFSILNIQGVRLFSLEVGTLNGWSPIEGGFTPTVSSFIIPHVIDFDKETGTYYFYDGYSLKSSDWIFTNVAPVTVEDNLTMMGSVAPDTILFKILDNGYILKTSFPNGMIMFGRYPTMTLVTSDSYQRRAKYGEDKSDISGYTLNATNGKVDWFVTDDNIYSFLRYPDDATTSMIEEVFVSSLNHGQTLW